MEKGLKGFKLNRYKELYKINFIMYSRMIGNVIMNRDIALKRLKVLLKC